MVWVYHSLLGAPFLEGEEAGSSTITVKARDYKAEASEKTFNVDFGTTPTTPTVSNDVSG